MKKQDYIYNYNEEENTILLENIKTNSRFRGELFNASNGKTYVRSQSQVDLAIISKYRRRFIK